ncbi:response regulator transcription factor [Clostridium malenominatum]|uniref:Stage 0 sporulation protein A homolog n=1 Tax=Clostridium malenominatum TaxID=1539 RepID=A0ABN1IYZ4_9CLOT
MCKKKILLIDDEEYIVELIKYNMEQNGFDVIYGYNGEEGIKLAEAEKPNIIILDVMMPGIDGYEVCKRIRNNKITKDIPIIMLTVKREEADKVIGLELGADDFVTKPFGVRELVARIKAVLRRVEKDDGEERELGVIVIGDIEIDPKKHEVKKNGVVLDLTLTEFKLLSVLAESRGNLLTREVLIGEVWPGEAMPESRVLDVHIRKLRQKIEDNDKYPVYIETVRGLGYKIK